MTAETDIISGTGTPMAGSEPVRAASCAAEIGDTTGAGDDMRSHPPPQPAAPMQADTSGHTTTIARVTL